MVDPGFPEQEGAVKADPASVHRARAPLFEKF